MTRAYGFVMVNVSGRLIASCTWDLKICFIVETLFLLSLLTPVHVQTHPYKKKEAADIFQVFLVAKIDSPEAEHG